MSFFNPFRKNNRPQGVKLSELNQESLAREDSGEKLQERREPSFGEATAAPLSPQVSQPSQTSQAPEAFAPSGSNPPAFAFADPEPEGPKSQPAPTEPPKISEAAARKPAPWDPYGIETVKNEPASSPEPTAPTQAAPEAASSSPLRPEAAAPTASPSPAPIVPEPIAEASAPALDAHQSEASVRREAEPAGGAPDEPVVRPVPRAQAAQQRREETPRPRVPSDAEILARRRTKHRLVGAAAILMAVVVAAPFILDSDPPIDDSGMKNVRMEIPKESETSTAVNTGETEKKPERAEVNVADTSMGSRGSTAQANLAREAGVKTSAAAEKKPAEKAPEKKAEPAKKSAPEAAKKSPQKSAGITPPTGKGWYVQVLATGNEEAAERTVRKMALLGLPAYKTKEGGSLWKVRAGLYGTRKEAEGAIGTIVLNGVAQKPYVSRQ